MYADDENGTGDGIEEEANAFATEILVGKKELSEFMAQKPHSAEKVRRFAANRGVHPGIVVGMLQHHGALPWAHLNFLKAKFEWKAK